MIYSLRASSKKTRIETDWIAVLPPACWPLRASSKKTRIETTPESPQLRRHPTRRASSKKTRIETPLLKIEGWASEVSEGEFQENKD